MRLKSNFTAVESALISNYEKTTDRSADIHLSIGNHPVWSSSSRLFLSEV